MPRGASSPAVHPGQEALREFFFTVAQNTYPLLAVGLARDHGMPPKEAWQFRHCGYYVQLVGALEVWKIPDDAPFLLEGFLQKLYHVRDESEPEIQAKSLNWLTKEVQKEEEEDLDPSIWE